MGVRAVSGSHPARGSDVQFVASARCKDFMKVAHVIPNLFSGGASGSLIWLSGRLAQAGAGQYVVSLGRVGASERRQLERNAAIVLESPEAQVIDDAIAWADIVFVHFWNEPGLARFLRAPHPAMRLTIWLKVYGGFAPQVLTSDLVTYADQLISTSSGSLCLPAIANAARAPICVPGCANFSSIVQRPRKPSDRVRVGYLGAVDFVKLHRHYVSMSSRVDRNVVFPVWGNGTAYPSLRADAEQMGTADRFAWHGPTSDVGSAFDAMDIFGYPLCSDTYAANDQALQEAMYAGLAAVVFDHPGLRDLAKDDVTAVVVREEREYVRAIERLIDDPERRRSIGAAAAAHIRQRFDPETQLDRIVNVLDDLAASMPKRTRSWTGPVLRADDGAGLFIETLGEFSDRFGRSFAARATDPADEEITKASPGLLNAGSGGILGYRNAFPGDPFLAFWSGLGLFGNEAFAPAIAEFIAARRLGLDGSRVDPWIRAAFAGTRGSPRVAIMAS